MANLPKLGNVDTQVVMRDLYDISYGIYNHAKAETGLSSVVMHPYENLSEDSYLNRLMLDYIHYSMFEFFHLNLVEYMEMPLHYKYQMKKIARQKLEEREKVAEDLLKQSEQMV
jgi:hypothetical protein